MKVKKGRLPSSETQDTCQVQIIFRDNCGFSKDDNATHGRLQFWGFECSPDSQNPSGKISWSANEIVQEKKKGAEDAPNSERRLSMNVEIWIFLRFLPWCNEFTESSKEMKCSSGRLYIDWKRHHASAGRRTRMRILVSWVRLTWGAVQTEDLESVIVSQWLVFNAHIKRKRSYWQHVHQRGFRWSMNLVNFAILMAAPLLFPLFYAFIRFHLKKAMGHKPTGVKSQWAFWGALWRQLTVGF